MKRQLALFPFGILAALYFTTYAEAAKPWQTALEKSLESTYEPTKMSFDCARITQVGTVLVIRKENISGDDAGRLSFGYNEIVDGTVTKSTAQGIVFKPGDKFYVRWIFVKDTEVRFVLISVDIHEVDVLGTTKKNRYQSTVDFRFPKGALETADAAAVKRIIDEVLATQATVDEKRTTTVELGQTPEQVEAALGKPETVAKLGAKMTYIYKTMKVIFQDGRVADVQ